MKLSNWWKLALLVCCVYNLNAQVKVSTQQTPNPNPFIAILEATEKTYAIDQILVCGEIFEDIYRGALGSPYFISDNFIKSTLLFKGRKYIDLPIKYDIYNQKILVDYQSDESRLLFYIPNEFIEQFEIKGKTFESITIHDTPQIYQVLEASDSLKCLYSWYKIRTESNHLGTRLSYEFSKEKQKKYILLNGELSKFSGKGSFLAIFPKTFKKQLKEFINSRKVVFSNFTDSDMLQLINYCNTLLTDNETL